MNETLTDIEIDFIDFAEAKTGRSREAVLTDYLTTKSHFAFNTPSYKHYCAESYLLHHVFYGESSEQELVAAYQHHALMHLYRFLSYSFPKTPQPFPKLRILVHALWHRDFKKISTYIKKVSGLLPSYTIEPTTPTELATYLLEKLERTPTRIVDYGCGPAYVSFEIAKQLKAKGLTTPTVTLVDIPSLISEFVLFRFKKHGVPVDFIAITSETIYPKLPTHDICLITEVMEHVNKPLEVIGNIDESLTKGGIILGNFEDHDKHLFHVSHDLSSLRAWLQEHQYKKFGEIAYKK